MLALPFYITLFLPSSKCVEAVNRGLLYGVLWTIDYKSALLESGIVEDLEML